MTHIRQHVFLNKSVVIAHERRGYLRMEIARNIIYISMFEITQSLRLFIPNMQLKYCSVVGAHIYMILQNTLVDTLMGLRQRAECDAHTHLCTVRIDCTIRP